MRQTAVMPNDLTRVLSGVGTRLRGLRKQRSITLEQLAAQTQISVSTLSRLESGQRRPTLELLLPLAQAFRIPLDELVGAPPTGDPRVHPRSMQRNGITWVQLAKDPGGTSAFKQIYPPGRAAGPELCVHDGYEWVYILSGRLRLTLGTENYDLDAGQAAEFDSRTPHGFANLGPGPLEQLLIVSSQGARVHLKVSDSTRSRECDQVINAHQ